MFVEQKTIILGLLQLKPFIEHSLEIEVPHMHSFLSRHEQLKQIMNTYIEAYQEHVEYDYDEVIYFTENGIKDLYQGVQRRDRNNQPMMKPDDVKLRELIKDEDGDNEDMLDFFELNLPKLYPLLHAWPEDIFDPAAPITALHKEMLQDYLRFSIPQYHNVTVVLTEMERHGRELTRQSETMKPKGEALTTVITELKDILLPIEKENPFLDTEHMSTMLDTYLEKIEMACKAKFLENPDMQPFSGWAKNIHIKLQSKLRTAFKTERIL